MLGKTFHVLVLVSVCVLWWHSVKRIDSIQGSRRAKTFHATVSSGKIGYAKTRSLLQSTSQPAPGPGPENICSEVQIISGNRINVPSGSVSATVTFPTSTSCTQGVHAPFPTIIMFAGYQVPTKYYKSLANAYAHSGFAVIQYDRNGQPSSQVESQYFDSLLAWQSSVNESTFAGPLSGLFAPTLGVTGHSMGGALASIAAGDHASVVKSVFLIDPVDYTPGSSRSSPAALTMYNKPVAIINIGVRCKDRTGCLPPAASMAMAEAQKPPAGCQPSWWCCDWSDGGPGFTSTLLPKGGADDFVAESPVGSFEVTLTNAGHMSFLDWNAATDPSLTISCPSTDSNPTEIKEAAKFMVAWAEHTLRGNGEVGNPFAALVEKGRSTAVVKSRKNNNAPSDEG